MKQRIQGVIAITQFDWQPREEASISFISTYGQPFKDTQTTIAIQPHTIEVEIPDEFDTTPQKIAALQSIKRELKAATQLELNHLESEIAKLQCLTYHTTTETASKAASDNATDVNPR